MLTPVITSQFERDYKRAKKRGKRLAKLQAVMDAILREEPLPTSYRDHKLSGNYSGRRECHIEPDWLLVYLIKESKAIFERTGTHSDIFGK